MKRFNESFYTKDYDQEMLDFIESEFPCDKVINGWSPSSKISLYYSSPCNMFYHSDYDHRDKTELTKQEFKEKIGMKTLYNGVDGEGNPLNFTKDDLKTGMILEKGDKEKVIVFLDCVHEYGSNPDSADSGVLIHRNRTSWDELSSYTDNLTHESIYSENWDIVKVFKAPHPYSFTQEHKDDEATLLWQRKTISKEEQESLDKKGSLESIVSSLQEQLEEAQTKLSEMEQAMNNFPKWYKVKNSKDKVEALEQEQSLMEGNPELRFTWSEAKLLLSKLDRLVEEGYNKSYETR